MLSWEGLKTEELRHLNGFIKTILNQNIDKRDFITIITPKERVLRETSLTSVNRVKLIDKHIDQWLNFDYYVRQLCKKENEVYTIWPEI